MAGTYRLVRGMRDILPDATGRWREVEEVVVDVLDRYGYTEIRLPLIEATELFSRGVGEATDLVEKEMFTFADRKGKSLSLRPEGTAGCARACIENGLLHNQTPKLWYRGSMFRYERPQKGRTREHTQIGAEVFGLPGPDIDAEMLTMLGRIFRELGIADSVALELNTIGSQDSRLRYRKALLDYLAPHAADLDPDSRRRLDTNPLRILDSKVATTRAIVAGAPRMDAYLDRASREHFEGLCRALDAAHVGYSVNPFLVRGLDYYTHTVFEWVTQALGRAERRVVRRPLRRLGGAARRSANARARVRDGARPGRPAARGERAAAPCAGGRLRGGGGGRSMPGTVPPWPSTFATTRHCASSSTPSAACAARSGRPTAAARAGP